MPDPDPCPDLEIIPWYRQVDDLPIARKMMVDLLEDSEPKSVVLIIQAALTDVAWLLREHEQLFLRTVAKMVYMGGVAESLSDEGCITVGDAMNVNYDRPSAEFVYRRMQELAIPMTITTRNATYKAMLTHEVFDRMGSIGAVMRKRVGLNSQRFWKSCCAPPGSKERGTLSPSRNREWFINTFCGGKDPGITGDDDITPHISTKSWALYDPINLIIALMPWLLGELFIPKTVVVNGVDHLIIGWSKEEHGVRDPHGLAALLEDLLVEGASYAKTGE